ncbi:MAG: response regulator [Bacteroidota bacterium]|nr:response regulator [Bacteroidota bacterium]
MARIVGNNLNKNNVNIFIVEDNELDAQVLTQEFELNTNYEIKQFLSGEHFLKYLIANPPHKKSIVIIVLNYILNSINIEAKNGIEILKTIKEINLDYEVIMISAQPDVDIVTSAIHYGAVTFVKKNENSFLRIQNNINWIISKKILKRKKASTIASIFIFALVLIVITISVLILIKYFPDLMQR